MMTFSGLGISLWSRSASVRATRKMRLNPRALNFFVSAMRSSRLWPGLASTFFIKRVAIKMCIEAILPRHMHLGRRADPRSNDGIGFALFTAHHFRQWRGRHINADIKSVEQGPGQTPDIFLSANRQTMTGQMRVLGIAAARRVHGGDKLKQC